MKPDAFNRVPRHRQARRLQDIADEVSETIELDGLENGTTGNGEVTTDIID